MDRCVFWAVRSVFFLFFFSLASWTPSGHCVPPEDGTLEIPFLFLKRATVTLDGAQLLSNEGWEETILRSDTSGENLVGLSLLQGFRHTTQQDWERAAACFKMAADNGNKSAAHNLAFFYEKGLGATAQDLQKSLESLQAYRDEKAATFNLFRYEALHGTETNAQSRALLEIAAEALNEKGLYGKQADLAKQLLERSDQMGNIEATLLLGRLYEKGDVFQKNVRIAKNYFIKGARQGQQSALKHLGMLAEKAGNLEEAIGWYEQGAPSSGTLKFFYARLCDRAKKTNDTPQTANSLAYLQQLEAEEHTGALVLLGKIHEQGRWVQRDATKAKSYYKRAAQRGSYTASIKLQLMEQGFQGVEVVGPLDLLLRTKVLYESKMAALDAELAKGYFIRNDHCSFDITADFQQAQAVMNQVQAERAQEPLQVNLGYLSADPYGIEQIGWETRPAISNAEFMEFARSLNSVLNRADAYVAGPFEGENTVMSIFAGVIRTVLGSSNTATIRQRILNLHDLWMANAQGDEAVARANFAMLFVQNHYRCGDGIAEFLSELEWQMLRSGEIGAQGGGMPLGAYLSQLFLDHKLKFMNEYRPRETVASEERTEAAVLLRQRMRLPLGLPGRFETLMYPHFGFGNEPRYVPSNVMSVFLGGGIVPFPGGAKQFEAYTPLKMLELMKASLAQESGILRKEPLISFVQQDPEIKEAFEGAFIEMEENKYFNPLANTAAGESEFKDDLLVEILLRHGYLLKLQD